MRLEFDLPLDEFLNQLDRRPPANLIRSHRTLRFQQGGVMLARGEARSADSPAAGTIVELTFPLSFRPLVTAAAGFTMTAVGIVRHRLEYAQLAVAIGTLIGLLSLISWRSGRRRIREQIQIGLSRREFRPKHAPNMLGLTGEST